MNDDKIYFCDECKKKEELIPKNTKTSQMIYCMHEYRKMKNIYTKKEEKEKENKNKNSITKL